MRATCLLSVWFLLQHIISIPRAEFLQSFSHTITRWLWAKLALPALAL